MTRFGEWIALPWMFLLAFSSMAFAQEVRDVRLVKICDLRWSERYERVLIKCGAEMAMVHLKRHNIELGARRADFLSELGRAKKRSDTSERVNLMRLLEEFQSNGMNYEQTASKDDLEKLNAIALGNPNLSGFEQFSVKGYRYDLEDGLPNTIWGMRIDDEGKIDVIDQPEPSAVITFLYHGYSIWNEIAPYTDYTILFWE